jgi:hypothetical protein
MVYTAPFLRLQGRFGLGPADHSSSTQTTFCPFLCHQAMLTPLNKKGQPPHSAHCPVAAAEKAPGGSCPVVSGARGSLIGLEREERLTGKVSASNISDAVSNPSACCVSAVACFMAVRSWKRNIVIPSKPVNHEPLYVVSLRFRDATAAVPCDLPCGHPALRPADNLRLPLVCTRAIPPASVAHTPLPIELN